MNRPTPAIVSQDAARRMPRLALVLLCLAYMLAGLVGREPWRGADMASFGYMLEIARGHTAWLDPRLLGLAPEADGLLPYWIGAAAISLAPAWVDPVAAARLPFLMLFALMLSATWYGVLSLARSPGARPVAFAFGGEASPRDYARAVADGGLLALIACLGLAQRSHETTTNLAQLAFAALAFHGAAALRERLALPAGSLFIGLAGLALSGAPSLAVYFGLGAALLLGLCADRSDAQRGERVLLAALVTVAVAVIATAIDAWRWRVLLPTDAQSRELRSIGKLLLWFTWPAWPLVIWTLWRWRRQWLARPVQWHLALPLWLLAGCLLAMVTTRQSDRALLLALPAIAALAAFALPALPRNLAAVIDWFTLLFFTGCGAIIWLIWIGMQTGTPRQAMINVLRQAPGFEPSFSLPALLIALSATAAWVWLVAWRVGRHPSAIWRSLVLPASGATLCWVLLTTLWLPLLDHVRSYTVVVRNLASVVGQAGCLETLDLSRDQIAALRHHGGFELRSAATPGPCAWLVVNPSAREALEQQASAAQWRLHAILRRPSDKADDMLVFRRIAR